jgi:hypothetical protein
MHFVSISCLLHRVYNFLAPCLFRVYFVSILQVAIMQATAPPLGGQFEDLEIQRPNICLDTPELCAPSVRYMRQTHTTCLFRVYSVSIPCLFRVYYVSIPCLKRMVK